MPALLGLGAFLVIAGLVAYGRRSSERERSALSDPVNANSARRSRAIQRRFNVSRWAGLVAASVGTGLLAIFVINEMLR
jgi:hypothetical protein